MTDNFDLILPTENDVADITVISDNFQKIDDRAVKKVSGKGLSSNDFTDEYKQGFDEMQQQFSEYETAGIITEPRLDEALLSVVYKSNVVDELTNSNKIITENYYRDRAMSGTTTSNPLVNKQYVDNLPSCGGGATYDIVKSGTTFEITDAKNGEKAKNIRIYGNSIGTTAEYDEFENELNSVGYYDGGSYYLNFFVKSKNLLNLTGNSVYIYGVNIAFENQSIKLNGIATASGGRNTAIIDNIVLGAGTYRFSCIKNNGDGAATVNIYLTDVNNANNFFYDGQSFTLTESRTFKLGINFNANVNYSSVVLYPMLEVGDKTTEYTPYFEPYITRFNLTAPLRKAENYEADYIDFDTKKLVRNTKVDENGNIVKLFPPQVSTVELDDVEIYGIGELPTLRDVPMTITAESGNVSPQIDITYSANLGDVIGGKYEFIDEIHIETDMELTSSNVININREKSGKNYNFKAVSIEMYGGAGATGDIRIEFAGLALFGAFFSAGRYSLIRGQYNNGVVFYDETHMASNTNVLNGNGHLLIPIVVTNKVSNIKFSNGNITAGSTIKIYGLR